MHGAAQWAVYNCLAGGNAAIFPDTVEHLDPVDVVRYVRCLEGMLIAVLADLGVEGAGRVEGAR